MNIMPRPNIVFSACLLGEKVRYNGKVINCPFAEELSEYVNVITVCPEVSIGLPVPRDPIITVRQNKTLKVINPKTGEDLTGKLKNFSMEFLSSLKGVDGFFLKAKSPSCGVSGTKTYKNPDGTGFFYRGKGIFASMVKKTFPYLPVEDELTLQDKARCFHFLLRIFLFAEMRQIKTEDELRKFHENYRYVFLLYSVSSYKRALQILKRKDKVDFIQLYKENLYFSLKRKPDIQKFPEYIKRYGGKFLKDISFFGINKLLNCLIPEKLLKC